MTSLVEGREVTDVLHSYEMSQRSQHHYTSTSVECLHWEPQGQWGLPDWGLCQSGVCRYTATSPSPALYRQRYRVTALCHHSQYRAALTPHSSHWLLVTNIRPPLSHYHRHCGGGGGGKVWSLKVPGIPLTDWLELWDSKPNSSRDSRASPVQSNTIRVMKIILSPHSTPLHFSLSPAKNCPSSSHLPPRGAAGSQAETSSASRLGRWSVVTRCGERERERERVETIHHCCPGAATPPRGSVNITLPPPSLLSPCPDINSFTSFAWNHQYSEPHTSHLTPPGLDHQVMSYTSTKVSVSVCMKLSLFQSLTLILSSSLCSREAWILCLFSFYKSNVK